mgnify:CR=1 FL=1
MSYEKNSYTCFDFMRLPAAFFLREEKHSETEIPCRRECEAERFYSFCVKVA